MLSIRQWSFRGNANKENTAPVEVTDKISIKSLESVENDQRMSASSCDSAGDAKSLNSLTINDDEMTKVAELRERLGPELLAKTPLYDDDKSLLRWISGWDSKWHEIIPRFQKSSEILECLGINELEFEGPDDINEYTSSLYPASSYFVGGLMGYDKYGNVIVSQSIGKIQPKILIHCGRVSDVFYLSIIEAAMTMKLIKKQEKKYSRRLGIVIILDLEGLCMDHLVLQTVRIYMNLLKILQDMFPDVAQKIFIINAPSLFASAYNLVKPAIAEKSRQKVQVLNSNYSKYLCDELGSENIFPHWGGTKKSERGTRETGTIRMGGTPPDSLRYIPLNNPFHIDETALKKLNVPARSKKTVQVECTKKGQILRWFFQTSSDLDFSVHYADKLAIPKFRIHTDFVPEFNHVKCHEVGTYTLCFDNSFSTFFSKEVRFHAYCVDPNHNIEKDVEVEKLED